MLALFTNALYVEMWSTKFLGLSQPLGCLASQLLFCHKADLWVEYGFLTMMQDGDNIIWPCFWGCAYSESMNLYHKLFQIVFLVLILFIFQYLMPLTSLWMITLMMLRMLTVFSACFTSSFSSTWMSCLLWTFCNMCGHICFTAYYWLNV